MSDIKRIENRATIQSLISTKKSFTFVDNAGITWNDFFLPDATDEDVFKCVCKWNMNIHMTQKPTFGLEAYPNGLVQMELPYENILIILKMELDVSVVERMKTELPNVNSFYENGNKEEGFSVSSVISPMQFIPKTIPLKEIIVPEILEIDIGSAKKLTASFLPPDANKTDLFYESTDLVSLSVDDNGVIRGLAKGDSYIIYSSIFFPNIHGISKVDVIVPLTNIILEENKEIYNDETDYLNITCLPEDARHKDVEWSSSNTSVATIDQNGLITPIKHGETYITATSIYYRSVFSTVKVTILSLLYGINIYLKDNITTLNVNTKENILVDFDPISGTDQILNWFSNNTNVVTVDNFGFINCLANGVATIEARSVVYPDVFDTYTITVVTPLENLILSGNSEINIGTPVSLNVQYVPSTTSFKDLIWESNNIAIATVDSNGLVTGMSNGIAIITARSSYNNAIFSSHQVTIITKTLSISTPEVINMFIDEELVIPVTFNPTNSSDKKLIYTSSNENVVRVTSTGLLQPISNGTAVITIVSEKYGMTDTTIVNITTELVGLTVTPKTDSFNKGSTKTLTPVYNPTTASYKDLTWSSSDNNIVSVDQYGNILGVEGGSAIVTVRSVDYPALYDTANITILVPLNSLSISGLGEVIRESTIKLTQIYNPTNTSYKGVTWTSSNNAIATVDQNGNVTGVKAGTVTITVRSTNNTGIYATKTITVQPKTFTLDVQNNPLTTTKSVGETLLNSIFYGTQGLKGETSVITSYNGVDVDFDSPSRQISMTTGKVTSTTNGIKFTTSDRCYVSVFVALKNTKNGVTISVLNNSGGNVSVQSITREGVSLGAFEGVSISAIEKYTFIIPSAGTYSIGGSGGGLYLYGLEAAF